MARYDLAVIGADLGGLAAAALLSSKGGKTIVIGMGQDLAASLGCLDRDGFAFTSGSSLLPARGQDRIFERFLPDSTAGDILSSRADVYQVALPDRRVTISRNRNETMEELRREFPRDYRVLDQCFRDLERLETKIAKGKVASFFAKRKSADSFLGHYGFSRELSVFFDLLSRFFFRLPLNKLLLPDFIELILHMPVRSYSLRSKVAGALKDQLVQRGGEIRFEETLPELARHGSRIKEVKSASGIIESRTILLDVQEDSQRILYAGIRENVIPVSMEKDVIYLPDYARPEEFLSVSLSDENDGSAAPAGMRALTCVFNNIEASCSKEILISRLGRLIPFLNDFIVLSDMKPVAVPREQDQRFKPVFGSAGPVGLYQASEKGMYMIEESSVSFFAQLHAARKLVKKIS